MRGPVIVVAAFSAIVIALVAVSRKRVAPPPPPSDDDPVPPSKPSGSSSGKPIVGEATDPAVAPLLAELQLAMDSAGITAFNAIDLTIMSKAPLKDGPDLDDNPTRPLAIPPRDLWAGMLKTAKVVSDVIDAELVGIPLRVTGYRPSDYNVAVGGAKDSAHVRATALDVWLGKSLLAGGDSAAIKKARERLKLAFARRWIAGGKIGFGVYTNDIHFDVDDKSGRRTWGDAEEWINKAKAAVS